ncbi:MAG: hypothetical protein AABX28_02620 [Nanoarchaeota archaeon]
MRRGVLSISLLLFAFLILSFSAGIYAQNETADDVNDNLQNADDSSVNNADDGSVNDIDEGAVSDEEVNAVEFEFEEGVELQADEGITPDSALYFVDEFLDGFGSELEVREEKVAEIRAMVQEGKIEEAKVALQNYVGHAEELEREISPEQIEDAQRSASEIYNAIVEIEDDIPEEDREEFLDILNSEERIVISAEIAGKIKELCETLSGLDPLEYSRICRTDDSAPRWMQELDDDLTEGQIQEAKLFGDIMSECFRTSGQQCRCEEIPFQDFAEMCAIAAPLATACDVNGDEDACEELNNLEMPELPEHLQDVFDSLERDVMGAQFEMHMPRECVEAGVTSERECMKVMVQIHAPEECRDAILEANVQNEREAREICEEIMFELNAPEECVQAGLRDPKECGKLMFRTHAPQECVDAGLTGEQRSDEKKCREIMESLGGGERRGGFGGNCRAIENQQERLACYDSAAQGAFEDFEQRGPPQGWPEPCERAQAFTRDSCEQIMRAQGEGSGEFGEHFREPQQEFGGEFTQPPQEFQQPEEFNEPVQQQPPQEFVEPAPEPVPEPAPEPTPEVTGGVIFNDDFSNYFFR